MRGQGYCHLNGSLVDCGIVLREAHDERGNKLIQCEYLSHPIPVPRLLSRRVTPAVRVYDQLFLTRASFLTVKDESAINTPAVAAAFAIKAYDARNDNEISLEVSPHLSLFPDCVVAQRESCSP